MSRSPQAVDVHVHLPTTEWLHGCLGPYLESVRRFFGAELTPRSVDEMAETYRAAMP
ncbi:hypothetical protein [Limnochorda pilosa]|uniref:Amidohydrolase 2 n=1 Tax=Limnochorda pilosa TaxID=1555112 RepID=A0A0K2SGG6_LIMPI|nr:hypothetical protein [Limnochorda pilosa]BAS26193.1 amidohydrolase 2 [Limnochorda pilosa]